MCSDPLSFNDFLMLYLSKEDYDAYIEAYEKWRGERFSGYAVIGNIGSGRTVVDAFMRGIHSNVIFVDDVTTVSTSLRSEIKKFAKSIPLYRPPTTKKEIADQRSYEMRKNGWNNPRSTWKKGTPTHRKKIKIRRREKDW